MKNKIKAVIFIVLFIAVVALIVYIITGSGKERDYEYITGSLETASPLETVAPTAEIATPRPSLYIPSPTPAATPSPTPTPEPTPEPTSEPLPAGTVLAEGKFSSDSGTDGMLDIDANYSAVVTGDSTVQVTVSVDLKHYSLNTIGGPRLHFSLGDQFASEDSVPIEYDGSEGRKVTTLGAHVFNIELATGQSVSLPLQVQWDFGGTYHNVEIDALSCGGAISIAR